MSYFSWSELFDFELLAGEIKFYSQFEKKNTFHFFLSLRTLAFETSKLKEDIHFRYFDPSEYFFLFCEGLYFFRC